jgi:hypothetical protein
VNFDLDRVEIKVEALPLIRRKLVISGATVEHPRFTVIEGEREGEKTGPAFPRLGAPFNDVPAMEVGGIYVADGELIYENRSHGKAVIELHDVHGEVRGFATRSGSVDFTAFARLEKSGSVTLRVAFAPFIENNDDHIEIAVVGQNLNELNRFFVPEAGIELKGSLRRAVAKLELRRGRLSGRLRAAYEDLEVKALATSDRGKLSAALQTLIQSMLTSRTRPSSPTRPDPVETVTAQRLPHEPITRLLARGLQKAAQQLITGR